MVYEFVIIHFALNEEEMEKNSLTTFRNGMPIRMQGNLKLIWGQRTRHVFQHVQLRGPVLSVHEDAMSPPLYINHIGDSGVKFRAIGNKVEVSNEAVFLQIICGDENEANVWFESMKIGMQTKFSRFYSLQSLLVDKLYWGDFAATSVCKKRVPYMVRIFRKDFSNMESVERVYREQHLACILRHPHVLEAIDLFNGVSKDALVFESMNGGTLSNLKSSSYPLSEDTSKSILRQVLFGLSYIHKLNIVHRNIAPENIYLSFTSEGVIAKLGGFSCANFKDDKIVSGLFSTIFNEDPYRSPDLSSGSKYSTVSDMWSIGVILFEMLTGKLPFTRSVDEKVYGDTPGGAIKISNAEMPHASADAIKLIKQTLQKDPFKRISAQAALAHDWFLPTPQRPKDSSMTQSSSHNFIDVFTGTKDEMTIVPFVMQVVLNGLFQTIELNRSRAEQLLKSPLVQVQLSLMLPFRRKLRVAALSFIAVCRMRFLIRQTCSTKTIIVQKMYTPTNCSMSEAQLKLQHNNSQKKVVVQASSAKCFCFPAPKRV